jgi:hypothetical protein
MKLNKKKFIIDILKLNHWLNVRKTTNQFFKLKQKSLFKKIKLKKNFSITSKELKFLHEKLSITLENIILQNKIPDYICWSKNEIEKQKDQLREMEFIFIIIIHYLYQMGLLDLLFLTFCALKKNFQS